jgi:hypothetical protein
MFRRKGIVGWREGREKLFLLGLLELSCCLSTFGEQILAGDEMAKSSGMPLVKGTLQNYYYRLQTSGILPQRAPERTETFT